MSEFFKRMEKKLNVFWHIDMMFMACHIVSTACSPGQRLVRVMWLCRALGQAWRLLATKGIEKSKLKVKNSSSKIWSSKGKIRKDLCLSHNENHGHKSFYASLHLKWLWRQPSASDQRHITLYHLRTTVALYQLGVTFVVSNCFPSSFVTFLACKVMYKILFLCKLYIK